VVDRLQEVYISILSETNVCGGLHWVNLPIYMLFGTTIFAN